MPWYVLVGVWSVAAVAAVVVLSRLFKDEHGDEEMLPELGRWPSDVTPFMLILDEDMVSARMVQACKKAIEFWEVNVPGLWTAFGAVSSGATVPLMPSWKLASWDTESGGSFGWTRITTRGGKIFSAAIYLDSNMVDEITDLQLWRAVAHELGHVLGLAHDDAIRSVMYSEAVDTVPTVTAADRARLLSIYT